MRLRCEHQNGPNVQAKHLDCVSMFRYVLLHAAVQNYYRSNELLWNTNNMDIFNV